VNSFTAMTGRQWIQLAATIVLGAAGGAAFFFAGLPAPWLSGTMVVVSAAALMQAPVFVPVWLRNVIFFVLGLSMGAGVPADVVSRVSIWPGSLVGLAVAMVLVTSTAYLWLTRRAGWDPATAFFASIPGALSYVLAISADTSADIRKVAVLQSIRVFILIVILPYVIIALVGDPGAAGESPPVTKATGQDLAILFAAGAAGAAIAMLVRLPGAILTGAFMVSAVAHGSGWIHAPMPAILLIPAMVILGCQIGTRFNGATLNEVRQLIRISLETFFITLTVAASVALVVSALTGISIGPVLLAYAPGGLEAMALLAFILGLDPAYVAVHQLARFMGLALVVPVVGKRWLAIRSKT